MKPARRPTPTAVSMRRWLCAWLALLTALQVAASLLAGLHGSLHRHRPGLQTSAPSTLALRWDHARRDATSAPLALHQALHQRGELHAHDLADASVVPIAAEVAHDALAQLGSTLAPSRHDAAHLHATTRHAPPHAAAWSATSRTIAPLLKPPRA
jgi:hypothetical protein